MSSQSTGTGTSTRIVYIPNPQCVVVRSRNTEIIARREFDDGHASCMLKTCHGAEFHRNRYVESIGDLPNSDREIFGT